MRVLLITGLSGAGRSVALKALEDMGCEATDNVPLALVPSLLASGGGASHRLVIGTDARSRDFSPAHFSDMLAVLRSQRDHDVRVLFLDCDDEVLQRRFTETRRKHPLALDRPVIDGIRHERSLLAPLRDMVDTVLDTSEWTNADLRSALREYFGIEQRNLSVFVTSFSFKRGVPRDADMVFDVRFLRNPYYDNALRDLNGLDAKVAAFVEADQDFAGFFDGLTNLVSPLLPRYLLEGKSYLTISIGCTGGWHRSVMVAEKLAGFLRKKEYKVGVRHRELVDK
jgi:RNase adapter protein RapZ